MIEWIVSSCILIVGCTFTGAAQPTEPTLETTETTAPDTTMPPPTTLPPETTAPTAPPYHKDIMAVPKVRLMGMLYVLDKDADSLTQQLPNGYVYIGFCSNFIGDDIPTTEKHSRNIPNHAELYASPEEPDYIYYDTGNGYQRLIRAALVENEVSKEDPSNWMPENYTLAFFRSLLWGSSANPYNQAVGHVFSQPEGVDLYEQFYNGFLEWTHGSVPLTDEEKAFLAAQGWSEDKPKENAKRFPISAMDEQLQRFFGITFAQSWKVGLHRFDHYREENQCYYHWRSDWRAYKTTILSIEHDPGSDYYHVIYKCIQNSTITYRMTLIRTDGILQIYSNVLAK